MSSIENRGRGAKNSSLCSCSKKGVPGFGAKKLLNGTRNYKFDWKVQARRKGVDDLKRLQYSGATLENT